MVAAAAPLCANDLVTNAAALGPAAAARWHFARRLAQAALAVGLDQTAAAIYRAGAEAALHALRGMAGPARSRTCRCGDDAAATRHPGSGRCGRPPRAPPPLRNTAGGPDHAPELRHWPISCPIDSGSHT